MENLSRRGRLVCIFFLLLSAVCPQIVLAQEYPNKSVTLVAPHTPGSDTDLIARPLASVAPEYLGQALLVQLKPGGLSIVGTDYVAKAPPDGYTLLMGGSGWNSALPGLEGRSKGPDEMEAVCRINYTSVIICARPGAPYKTIRELIAWVKANPGKLVVGYGGPYAPMRMFWLQLMKQDPGISIRTITFDGGGEMILAALGGHTDITGGTSQMLLPHIRAKKLMPLAYLDKERHRDFPDVPSIAEEGISIPMFPMWRGILAPKGTPHPIIDKLGVAFKKMTEDKSLQAMMEKASLDIQYLSPDEFAKFWRTDYEYYKGLRSSFGK